VAQVGRQGQHVLADPLATGRTCLQRVLSS
jgi:hypothetical protein